MHRIRPPIIFTAGILTGLLIAVGIMEFSGRSHGNFGGEYFILPLMLLFVVFGIQIEKGMRYYRRIQRRGKKIAERCNRPTTRHTPKLSHTREQ